MNYRAADHTFALCAYGDSPYLEECILSLKAQTVQTRILISTSTPSEHISAIAEKYALPVYVNTGRSGIGGDWNAAYDRTETKLVTIAHQDDLYEPGYTEAMLRAVNEEKDPLLFFCGYRELRNGEKVSSNKNLRIKRLMLTPLKGRLFRNSRFIRRRILSLGCPVCCPSVTYVREKTGPAPFSTEMKVSLDWDMWERLSRKKGAFIYLPEQLMCHRIHRGSATTAMIGESMRTREDLEMFRRFWPGGIARLLGKLYADSEKSNNA